MNERIQKFAKQCTTIYNSTTFPVDKDFDYEKFAELIVRECILISRTSTDGFAAGRRMEERFGVE